MNFGDFSVKALLILALALFAVGSSWLAWFENNARLEAEIEMVERRFQAMTKEHQAAIEAADSAIAARREAPMARSGLHGSRIAVMLSSLPAFMGWES